MMVMFVCMNSESTSSIQRINARAHKKALSISNMIDLVAEYKYDYEDMHNVLMFIIKNHNNLLWIRNRALRILRTL